MRSYLLTIILMLCSVNVFAVNISFLNDSAITNFTKDDLAIFDAAWDNALNHAPDHKKVLWSNPKTGTNGYFIPMDKFKRDNNICRHLKMYYQSRGQTSKYQFTFCKFANEWKAV